MMVYSASCRGGSRRRPPETSSGPGKLRELVLDADRRRRIGAAGRAVAESYTERRYVDGLLEFIDETHRATPALNFIDRVADELGHMRVDDDSPSSKDHR